MVAPADTWTNPDPTTISFLPFLPTSPLHTNPLLPLPPPPPTQPPPSFIASLSQDAFSLLASYMPLASLLTLRQLSHRFHALSQHPHAYASQHAPRTLRSLQPAYLLRLSAVHPHLRALAVPFPQCEAADADALSFLFASFPSLAALHLTALPHQPYLPLPPSSSLTALHLVSPRLARGAFAALSLCRSLVELVVVDGALGDDALLLLSTLPRLQRLGLSQCGLVTDRGVGWLLGVEVGVGVGGGGGGVGVDECYAVVEQYVEQRSAWSGAWQHNISGPSSSLAPSAFASASSTYSHHLHSFATLYSLSPVYAGAERCTTLSSSQPLSRTLTTDVLHDHVASVMDHVGHLGPAHSGLSMLSRSMSTPSFARHSTLTLAAAAAAEEETASPTSDGDDSGHSPPSSADEPPDPADAAAKEAAVYRPSPVARTLRSLDVSHCRLLTDAAALYVAYAAVCTTAHASCACYSDPAACTLLPLRALDVSYCQGMGDFAVACVATLPHLAALSLSHQPLLTDVSLLLLQPLPHLAALRLTQLPHLTTHSLAGLAALLSLTTLHLSALPHLTDQATLLLSTLPFLDTLQLEVAPLLTDLALASLGTSGSLQAVGLLGLGGVTGRGLMAVGRCRGLRRLEVRGCKWVTDEDKERLRHARRDLEVI